MKNATNFALALLATALVFSASAHADAIEIVALDDIDGLADGALPDMLGGHELTPLAAPENGDHSCTAAPSGDDLCFADYWGNSVDLTAGAPGWWEYPEHGNIFVVHGYHWIDIILPANTYALTLFVGASGPGSAWIQATDGTTTTPQEHFSVNNGNTSGYGVYATGCTPLTSVTVEPWEWGFGHLAISQGACAAVPEPAPIALFGLGLLGLLASQRVQLQRQRV